MRFLLLSLLLISAATTVYAQFELRSSPRSIPLVQVVRSNNTVVAANENTAYYSTSLGIRWKDLPYSVNQAAYRVLRATDTYIYTYLDNPRSLVRINSLTFGIDTLETPDFNAYFFTEGFAVGANDQLFIGTSGNGVLRSDDLGENWTLVYDSEGAYIGECFYSNGILYANQDYQMQRSTDNGTTWETVEIAGELYKVNGDILITRANPTGGQHHYSIDRGDTWQSIDLPEGNSDATMSTQQGLLFVLYPGRVYRSNDLGQSWELILEDATGMDFYDVNQKDDLLLVTSYRGLYRSFDNGANWYIGGADANGGVVQVGNIQALTSDLLLTYSGVNAFISNSNSRFWQGLVYYNIMPEIRRIDDGYYAVIDRNNEPLLLKSTAPLVSWDTIATGLPIGINSMYTEGQKLVVKDYLDDWYESEDEGQNWSGLGSLGDTVRAYTVFRDTLYSVMYNRDIYAAYPWLSEPQLIADINNGIGYTKMYHSGDYCYVDEGNSRTARSSDMRNWSPLNLPSWATNSTLRRIPNGSEFFIYVPDHDNSKIYFTQDLGVYWQPIDLPFEISFFSEADQVFTHEDELFVRRDDAIGSIYATAIAPFRLPLTKGTVFDDLNNNGVRDLGEPPLENVQVNAVLTQNTDFTDEAGQFWITIPTAPDTLRVDFAYKYVTVSPPYHLSDGEEATDFAVHFLPDVVDWRLNGSVNGVLRPGFETDLTFTYFNDGTATYSDTLWLVLDPTMELLDSSLPISSTSGDTLRFILPELERKRYALLKLRVRIDNTAPIGSILQVDACIPAAGDSMPLNNCTALIQELVGSYDPNDKQVSPLRYDIDHLRDSVPLEYLIRFQNTGNYPASFVRIEDELDLGLDLTTIKVLSYSHPMTYSFTEPRKIVFYFDDIFLPDSISNEPASHGFVKFQIQANQSLGIGDSLQNKASIFFDFNEPIITNTVVSELFPLITTTQNLPYSYLPLQIFPNPSDGHCELQITDTTVSEGEVLVFNSLGQLVHRLATNTNQASLRLNVPAGWYSLHWLVGEQHYRGQWLVQ